MSPLTYVALAAGSLALLHEASAQSSPTNPEAEHTIARPLYEPGAKDALPSAHAGAVVNSNAPATVASELMDPGLLPSLAAASELSASDLTNLCIGRHAWMPRSISLISTGQPGRAFTVLCPQLEAYVKWRRDGHTRRFCLAALTNVTKTASPADRDLQFLLQACPELAPFSLAKHPPATGLTTNFTITNLNGPTNDPWRVLETTEAFRQVTFTLVDGEVAWHYSITVGTNGLLPGHLSVKIDAREADPTYNKVFDDVRAEVAEELRQWKQNPQKGIPRSWTDCMKAKLAAKGITNWHSQAELNPFILH
jgi:hypothetical protein